jgi:outer membrane murein-binding lipoprotein Lpp
MRELSEKTPIALGLVFSIAGGAFWLSAVNSKVDMLTDSVSELRSDIKELAQQTAPMRTDIEVIRTKVQLMEKPVFHTHEDVKHIRNSFAKFEGPLELHRRDVCERYNPGQFSMMEKGR